MEVKYTKDLDSGLKSACRSIKQTGALNTHEKGITITNLSNQLDIRLQELGDNGYLINHNRCVEVRFQKRRANFRI